MDQHRLSDAPHQRYYDNGVPVLLETPFGNVIEKAIREYTVKCPECSTKEQVVHGRYDANEDPVCPRCGLLLSGDGTPQTEDASPILSDAKAAGRVDTETTN
jgi:hypothetical protein